MNKKEKKKKPNNYLLFGTFIAILVPFFISCCTVAFSGSVIPLAILLFLLFLFAIIDAFISGKKSKKGEEDDG